MLQFLKQKIIVPLLIVGIFVGVPGEVLSAPCCPSNQRRCWLLGSSLIASGIAGAAAFATKKSSYGRRGKEGATGAMGDPGTDGFNGMNGMNGQPGLPGIPGIAGPIGPNGSQGSCVRDCDQACQPTLDDFQNQITFTFGGNFDPAETTLALEAIVFDPLGNMIFSSEYGPLLGTSSLIFVHGPPAILGVYEINIQISNPGTSTTLFQASVDVVSSGPGRPGVNETFHTLAIFADTTFDRFFFTVNYELSCSSFTAP